MIVPMAKIQFNRMKLSLTRHLVAQFY